MQMPQETCNSNHFFHHWSTTQILLNETCAVVLPQLNSPRVLTHPREKWFSQATVSLNSQQFPSVYKYHCLKSLAYSATYSRDHWSLNERGKKNKNNKPKPTPTLNSTHIQPSVFPEQRESKKLCGAFSFTVPLRKVMGNCWAKHFISRWKI